MVVLSHDFSLIPALWTNTVCPTISSCIISALFLNYKYYDVSYITCFYGTSYIISIAGFRITLNQFICL